MLVVKKEIKCSASLTFYLFSPTCLINSIKHASITFYLFSPTCLMNSIKHEHSCKILYVYFLAQLYGPPPEKIKDFSRPLCDFPVLFKAYVFFKDFSRKPSKFKYFSSLCKPCVCKQKRCRLACASVQSDQYFSYSRWYVPCVLVPIIFR